MTLRPDCTPRSTVPGVVDTAVNPPRITRRGRLGPHPLVWLPVWGIFLICLGVLGAEEPGSPPGLRRGDSPFARLWNQQFFVGPGVLAAKSAETDPKLRWRLPGDFEPHGALLMVGGRLAQQFPDVLAGIAAATGEKTPLVLLVASPEERKRVLDALMARELPAGSVRFVEVPTDTVWIRDFGPIFVTRADGAVNVLDADYGKPDRGRDDGVPRAAARALKVPVVDTPLLLQGGNLLSNGRGLLVTTTTAVNRNIFYGYDTARLTRFLGTYLGARQIVVLEPLEGEITGHADVFACFTSPDTILVGEYPASVDPLNAARLDRNAARLAAVETGGKKLRVIRVPMPTNEDGKWRTYTNVIFANGTLLMPSYPQVDPAVQRRAMGIFRRVLHGWKVVGVDAEALVAQEGGLRCITTHLPPRAAASRDRATDGR